MPQVMSSSPSLSNPLYLDVSSCSPPDSRYNLQHFSMLNSKNMFDINSLYENILHEHANLSAFNSLAESFNYFCDKRRPSTESKHSPTKSFSIESILGFPGSDDKSGNILHNRYGLHDSTFKDKDYPDYNLKPSAQNCPQQPNKVCSMQLSKKKSSSKIHKSRGAGGGIGTAAMSAGAAKSKRIRTIFTPEQLERLELEFERQQYMVGTGRLYLASTLNLTEAQVKVWFQNRRIKWRKKHLEEHQDKGTNV